MSSYTLNLTLLNVVVLVLVVHRVATKAEEVRLRTYNRQIQLVV